MPRGLYVAGTRCGDVSHRLDARDLRRFSCRSASSVSVGNCDGRAHVAAGRDLVVALPPPRGGDDPQRAPARDDRTALSHALRVDGRLELRPLRRHALGFRHGTSDAHGLRCDANKVKGVHAALDDD